MTRPNFTAAQTLLMISRLGTFTAAAQALNTTQSAISARMRELERALGFEIFVRQGRGLRLTLAAEQLVDRIEPLIQALDEAFQDAEQTADPQGLLRIGIVEMATGPFSRMVPRLHGAFPRLQYSLSVDLSANIMHEIEVGNLDIGIVAAPRSNSALRLTQLGSTRLGWVCARSLTRDAEGNERSSASLLREVLLWTPPKASPSYQPACEQLLAHGANFSNLCSTSNGLLEIALAGGGAVFVPDAMSEAYLLDGRLVRVLAPHPTYSLKLFVAVEAQQRQKVVLAVEQTLLAKADAALR